MSKREENEQQRVSRDSRIQEKECAEKKIKNKKIDRIILATNCNPHLEVDVCVIYSLAKFMKAIINIISGERGTRNKF